jgi:hypothetical protein
LVVPLIIAVTFSIKVPCADSVVGGVSDLDTVILNPEHSQYVKATYVHIWNTTGVSSSD